jgi:hypothetical protein
MLAKGRIVPSQPERQSGVAPEFLLLLQRCLKLEPHNLCAGMCFTGAAVLQKKTRNATLLRRAIPAGIIRVA